MLHLALVRRRQVQAGVRGAVGDGGVRGRRSIGRRHRDRGRVSVCRPPVRRTSFLPLVFWIYLHKCRIDILGGVLIGSLTRDLINV